MALCTGLRVSGNSVLYVVAYYSAGNSLQSPQDVPVGPYGAKILVAGSRLIITPAFSPGTRMQFAVQVLAEMAQRRVVLDLTHKKFLTLAQALADVPAPETSAAEPTEIVYCKFEFVADFIPVLTAQLTPGGTPIGPGGTYFTPLGPVPYERALNIAKQQQIHVLMGRTADVTGEEMSDALMGCEDWPEIDAGELVQCLVIAGQNHRLRAWLNGPLHVAPDGRSYYEPGADTRAVFPGGCAVITTGCVSFEMARQSLVE